MARQSQSQLRIVEGGKSEWVQAARARRARRSRRGVWGRKWNSLAPFLISLLALVGIVTTGIWRVNQKEAYSFTPTVPVSIPVVVRPGDTLWSIARRYGKPDRYILDRVDSLAKINHLPPNTALEAGQRVLVPVENPQEWARLKQIASGDLASPLVR